MGRRPAPAIGDIGGPPEAGPAQQLCVEPGSYAVIRPNVDTADGCDRKAVAHGGYLRSPGFRGACEMSALLPASHSSRTPRGNSRPSADRASAVPCTHQRGGRGPALLAAAQRWGIAPDVVDPGIAACSPLDLAATTRQGRAFVDHICIAAGAAGVRTVAPNSAWHLDAEPVPAQGGHQQHALC